MQTSILQNPDLNGNSFFMPGANDTGVLLFHGFTSTTVEVRPLAEYLTRAGYTTSAPLLPGHGTRPEDALRIKRDDWLRSAEQAYLDMKPRVKKIIAAGESMGCLLALHLAHQYPEIRGLLLFAPAVKIKGQWKAQFAAPFKKIVPKYYLPAPRSSEAEDVLPWQGYNVIPVPAAAQFYKLQRSLRRKYGQIKQPALIFQGKLDTTIDPSGAESLYHDLPSQDKQLIWLDNSRHTLLLGVEHAYVYDESLKFIKRITD